MSLRSRVFLATALSILVPFLIVAYAIRTGVKTRMTNMYIDKVESTATLLEDDMSRRGQALAARLDGLKAEILDDNRFRRALVSEDEELARYKIDYAGHMMKLAGLSLFQIRY